MVVRSTGQENLWRRRQCDSNLYCWCSYFSLVQSVRKIQSKVSLDTYSKNAFEIYLSMRGQLLVRRSLLIFNFRKKTHSVSPESGCYGANRLSQCGQNHLSWTSRYLLCCCSIAYFRWPFRMMQAVQVFLTLARQSASNLLTEHSITWLAEWWQVLISILINSVEDYTTGELQNGQTSLWVFQKRLLDDRLISALAATLNWRARKNRPEKHHKQGCFCGVPLLKGQVSRSGLTERWVFVVQGARWWMTGLDLSLLRIMRI